MGSTSLGNLDPEAARTERNNIRRVSEQHAQGVRTSRKCSGAGIAAIVVCSLMIIAGITVGAYAAANPDWLQN